MPFCSLTLTAKKPSKMPQYPRTIGNHIMKRRLGLGLTQLQLAAILSVAECTVTNWEINRTRPQLRLMPKVLQFLGYEPCPVQAESLGERLLQYRKRRGISQRQLAIRMGIDPTTLSRVERRRENFSVSTNSKISNFLLKNSQ